MTFAVQYIYISIRVRVDAFIKRETNLNIYGELQKHQESRLGNHLLRRN